GRVDGIRRDAVLRSALIGGDLRAEAHGQGLSLGSEGFEPADRGRKAQNEARMRLKRYQQRLQAVRSEALAGAVADASPAAGSSQRDISGRTDSVRAALWDLDRTGVTLELLRETGIGVELNKSFWRQHQAEDIAEMSTELVGRWKSLLK
ncbi:unnamed protein product, partial [Polarella glacialis]